jgi:hypothetical protein
VCKSIVEILEALDNRGGEILKGFTACQGLAVQLQPPQIVYQLPFHLVSTVINGQASYDADASKPEISGTMQLVIDLSKGQELNTKP